MRICVTLFFATYSLFLIYSSALLKLFFRAIVRSSDSSSLFFLLLLPMILLQVKSVKSRFPLKPRLLCSTVMFLKVNLKQFECNIIINLIKHGI